MIYLQFIDYYLSINISTVVWSAASIQVQLFSLKQFAEWLVSENMLLISDLTQETLSSIANTAIHKETRISTNVSPTYLFTLWLMTL